MSKVEIIQMLIPLLLLEISLMVFALYRLSKDRVRYIPKWCWILIIVFAQTIGPLAYLIFGRERD